MTQPLGLSGLKWMDSQVCVGLSEHNLCCATVLLDRSVSSHSLCVFQFLKSLKEKLVVVFNSFVWGE